MLAHQRRRVLHFNVTEHPTAEWAAQQIVEAFPEDTVPRYLIKRTVALSLTTQSLITQWRQQSRSCDPDAWVFPSAKLTTPLGRDNAWRGLIAPRLKTIQLEWATFQIMRRAHATLSRQVGIDPKLVADQLATDWV